MTAGRLDEDRERLLAAITPYGFQLRPPHKQSFGDLQLQAFDAPDNVITQLSGEIDGARVDLFEYDGVRTQPNNSLVVRERRIVAVVRHPAIDGTARCRRVLFQTLGGEIFEWAVVTIFFLLFFWLIIPFWISWYFKGKSFWGRDWRVGVDEFDKRFEVDGPSHAEAIRALPVKFQELALADDLKGPIEVRPGILALNLESQHLDSKTFEHAFALMKKALAAYTPVQPGLAYRVASYIAPEPEEESEATEGKRLEK